MSSPRMEVKCPISPIFIQRNPEESRGDGKSKIGVVFFKMMAFFQVALLLNSHKWPNDSVSGGSPKKSLQWLRTGDGTRRFRSILVPKSR